ncbi:heparinase II/III-family protein [Devosia sp. A8/3-2]|nr:heparinase II/III-family protein [Devosia sp. A8/3-2]
MPALAFEFSHGNELIPGSCGPAPADLPESRALFRQTVAHSAPSIDAEDAERTPPSSRSTRPIICSRLAQPAMPSAMVLTRNAG